MKMSDDFNVEIGQKIRALRKKRGWTLKMLAEKANRSPIHLGYVERGQRPLSADLAIRLAHAFHVSMKDLMGPFDNCKTDRAPTNEDSIISITTQILENDTFWEIIRAAQLIVQNVDLLEELCRHYSG